MLANFFGKSKPVNYPVLFALFLCYFLLAAFAKPFSIEIFKELFWFVVIFSVFNFIIAKNNLTYDNSYPFLFYVLLIGLFPEVIKINSLLFANVTVLLFLRKVYSLQSSKNILHKLFDGGLWLGISFLIEPYTAVFGLLLYTSIYLHQRFTYQTLFTPLLGFFGPVFLYFTYYFWNDKTEIFNKLFAWYSDYNFEVYLSNNYLVPIVIVGFYTVCALFLKTPKAFAVKNTFRKNWTLILLHLSLSFIIVFLIDDKEISELQFLFFPTAVVLTNGVELFKKKWLVDVLLILLLICSFVIYFL